jgi:hypothetical protein
VGVGVAAVVFEAVVAPRLRVGFVLSCDVKTRGVKLAILKSWVAARRADSWWMRSSRRFLGVSRRTAVVVSLM